MAVTVIAAAVLAAPRSAMADSAQGLTAQTPDGAPFAVPAGLAQDADILVLGFTRAAGSASRAWVLRLRRDFPEADGFAVYSVAVIAGVPALFRPLALASIRGSVRPDDRGRFLVVDHDLAAWRAFAGEGTPDDPRIVVLERGGAVVDREGGPFDESGYREAAARIRSAAGRKS